MASVVDWAIIKPGSGRYHDASPAPPPNQWRYPDQADSMDPANVADADAYRCVKKKRFIITPAQSYSHAIYVNYNLVRLAVRWTMTGMVEGRRVVLMAESHLHCVGVRIVREITVYDDVAVR